MPLEEILRPSQVAALLQVHVKTVYRLAENGSIPGKRIGRSWRFSKADVLDLATHRTTNRLIAEPNCDADGGSQRAMTDNALEILLVEDNPNDVKLTLHALKKSHITNHLHVVRDGAEALDFIFCTGAYSERNIQNTPKVILLNLKLPKVDGMEVLRQVKADPRTRMTPVVVLTSSREERDIVENYRLGVNSYIVKPVDFEKFTEAVQRMGLYWLLLNQPMRT